MQKENPEFYRKNQNKIFILGFVLILAVISWSLVRPIIFKNTQKEEKDSKINEEILKAPLITLKEFSEKIRDNEKLFIVDLRNAGDFSAGHIAGAINFLPGTGLADQIKKAGAENTTNIVIVNKGENVFEAAEAANDIIAAGFVNAKYLRGGITDWRNEGYTLVSGGNSPGDQSKIKKITVEKLASELSGGDELVQFIDIRDKEKFNQGHIPRSINLPLPHLESNQKAISPVKKAVVYGENEEEASKAAVILFDLNFFNVYVLDGGLASWKNNNGKIVSD